MQPNPAKKIYKKIKTSTPLLTNLLAWGIPPNKIRNTVALLHWLCYAQRKNIKENTFKEEGGIKLFPVSRINFQNHLDKHYRAILDILTARGLIITDNSYSFGEKGSKVKYYGPTEKLKDELDKHSDEYLDNILKDPLIFKTLRKHEKYLSDSEFHDPLVAREMRNEVEAVKGFIANWDGVKRTINRLSRDTRIINRGYLVSLLEEKIDKWKERDLKTGRIFTRLNNISGVIRKYAVIEGKAFALDIDMRACHFSFFADYLCSMEPENKRLAEERDKWREIFISKTEHPRDFFARQLGMKPENVKELMNSFINGKKYPAMNAYLKEYWRPLHRAFAKMEKGAVGNAISRDFESKVLRGAFLHDLESKHNVATISTHDGFMIFGSEDDALLFAAEFIKKAQEIAGWAVYFTIKNEVEFDYWGEKRIIEDHIADAEEKNDWARVATLREKLTDFINRNEIKYAA